MNHRIRLTPRLLLVITLFITLGCGAASQAAATLTPEAVKVAALTEEPTESPVEEPAQESEELPDISSARLYLEDLPSGFEEIPADELNSEPPVPDEEGFVPGQTFGFFNSDEFQMIMGANFLTEGALDQLGVNLALSQQEMVMEEFVTMLGTEVRGQEILDGFEDVGDSRTAMRMLADMEGTPMQVEVIVLQRDSISGMLMSMTLAGQTPAVSLHDLGLLFDERIQATVETLP